MDPIVKNVSRNRIFEPAEADESVEPWPRLSSWLSSGCWLPQARYKVTVAMTTKRKQLAKWKTGVAFVRGINMFHHAQTPKKDMLARGKTLENENLNIVDMYRCDNIVFRKRRMLYAGVGAKLETLLSNHFGRKVSVTTRSLRTVEGICRREYGYR